MTDDQPSRTFLAMAAAAAVAVALGLAHAALVVMAVARIVDPGWGTVDAIGVLAGLGMAAGAVACVTWLRDSGRLPTWVGALGVGAGLAYAGVWLTLGGGTFYTYDSVRLAILVISDALFAVCLIGIARLATRTRPVALFQLLAILMTLRAIGELLLFVPYVTGPSGRGGPFVIAIVAAGLVLAGWIILAIWEITLGALLLRSRDQRRAPTPRVA